MHNSIYLSAHSKFGITYMSYFASRDKKSSFQRNPADGSAPRKPSTPATTRPGWRWSCAAGTNNVGRSSSPRLPTASDTALEKSAFPLPHLLFQLDKVSKSPMKILTDFRKEIAGKTEKRKRNIKHENANSMKIPVI